MSESTLKEGKVKKKKEKEEVAGAPMEFHERIAGVHAGIWVTVPMQKAKCQDTEAYVSVTQFSGEVGKITAEGTWVLGSPKMSIMDRKRVEEFVEKHKKLIKETYQNNKQFGKTGSD